MGHLKVICSGSVIEIYECEKDLVPRKQDLDAEKYNQYEKMLLGISDNEKKWIYEKEERGEERRKQTMRDARNLTRRLALMNFGIGDTFMTLTYPDERHLTVNEIDVADDDFKKFMKRMRYRYGDMKYLAVREFTKKGRIHFHILCTWRPEGLTDEFLVKELEREIGEKVWKHGFVDLKVLSGVDNVGAYLIKYMTKDVSMAAFKGRKSFLCSKGLDRPVEMTGEDAERVIEFYGLRDKKEVFTNSYESEYLGCISYKEYNLQRMRTDMIIDDEGQKNNHRA